MLYGSYKNARNAAWQCLLDFNISELPVKPSTIAKQSGIKIIKNSSINELSKGESGATYLINSNGISFIMIQSPGSAADLQ